MVIAKEIIKAAAVILIEFSPIIVRISRSYLNQIIRGRRVGSLATTARGTRLPNPKMPTLSLESSFPASFHMLSDRLFRGRLWRQRTVLLRETYNWTVERSCSLFQFKDFSVAAAGGADFGCEEFLEGNAFG
jgi:hypothetical protein